MKIILLALMMLPLWVSAQIELRPAMEKMADALVKTQGVDGRFEGTFEADPGFELLTLVLLKKYGHRDLQIEKAFVQKALEWKTHDGFGYYPKGPYSHDVTGLVLLSLKSLGYKYSDLGLGAIYQRFIQNGGEDKLNLGTKILMAPLGLVSSRLIDSALSVSILGIPESFPLGEKSLGIFRSLIIPITTWNYYRHQNSDRDSFHLAMIGDKQRAIEGLEWILHRQMSNGTWYTIFHTIVNVSALDEAQKAGVGNFSKQIQKSLEAIKKWRTKNSRGEITQQLTLTTGWDTPQTLIALSELPDDIKSRYTNEAARAVNFLDKKPDH